MAVTILRPTGLYATLLYLRNGQFAAGLLRARLDRRPGKSRERTAICCGGWRRLSRVSSLVQRRMRRSQLVSSRTSTHTTLEPWVERGTGREPRPEAPPTQSITLLLLYVRTLYGYSVYSVGLIIRCGLYGVVGPWVKTLLMGISLGGGTTTSSSTAAGCSPSLEI